MSEARARLDALPTRYPHFFPSGPLPWGFEVGEGWTSLIETLFARIDTLVHEAPGVSIEILQVKEKFGGLRFYYALNGADEATAQALHEAVDLAAVASTHICERCGRPGDLHNRSGWLGTLCAACAALPP